MTSVARRIAVPLALAALSLAALSTARAESRAHILETQPSASATLGRNESFYVRMEYDTDEPISLWARPYLNGNEVEEAMSNASRLRSPRRSWFSSCCASSSIRRAIPPRTISGPSRSSCSERPRW